MANGGFCQGHDGPAFYTYQTLLDRMGYKYWQGALSDTDLSKVDIIDSESVIFVASLPGGKLEKQNVLLPPNGDRSLAIPAEFSALEIGDVNFESIRNQRLSNHLVVVRGRLVQSKKNQASTRSSFIKVDQLNIVGESFEKYQIRPLLKDEKALVDKVEGR